MGKIGNNKMTYLYLIEMTSVKGDEKFYKIGVANKGVYIRYFYDKKMVYSIKILVEVLMDTETALKYEDFIKYKYLPYLYKPKVPFAGSKTECFSICPQVAIDTKMTATREANDKGDKLDFNLISNLNFYCVKNLPKYFYELVDKPKNSTSIFSNNSIKDSTNAYQYILTQINKKPYLFEAKPDKEGGSVYVNYNILCADELKDCLKSKGFSKLINPSEKFFSTYVFLWDSFSLLYCKDLYVQKHFAFEKLNKYFAPYKDFLKDNKLNVFIFNEKHLDNIRKYIPDIEYKYVNYFDMFKVEN